jgi:subtilisin family serine protease
MDRTDTRWAKSNYGGCVDGYAPGVDVLSSLPGNRTGSWSGTSMATPHVAGMVALAKQAFGDRPSATYVQWLISNATPNAIQANPVGTPNRLVWKGSL